MRITGGTARGIPLKCPPKGTRPATDALREALCSSLSEALTAACVLDLFAGTGAYGLELLSRGATHVTFYEKHPLALKCLQDNIQSVCKSAQLERRLVTTLQRKDVFRLDQLSGQYDIIISDPPYDLLDTFFEKTLPQIPFWLKPNGYWVIECPANTPEFKLENAQEVKRLGKTRGQNPSLRIYQMSLHS